MTRIATELRSFLNEVEAGEVGADDPRVKEAVRLGLCRHTWTRPVLTGEGFRRLDRYRGTKELTA